MFMVMLFPEHMQEVILGNDCNIVIVGPEAQ